MVVGLHSLSAVVVDTHFVNESNNMLLAHGILVGFPWIIIHLPYRIQADHGVILSVPCVKASVAAITLTKLMINIFDDSALKIPHPLYLRKLYQSMVKTNSRS